MSLEKRYKDYFRDKTTNEFYELLKKFKMFIDLTLQESITGEPEERIKGMFKSLQQIRDSINFELNNYNHKLNLEKIEIDMLKFEELNKEVLDGTKKNLDQEAEQANDQ